MFIIFVKDYSFTVNVLRILNL